MKRWLLPLVLAAARLTGCKDTDRFVTLPGESWQGSVVKGTFVRAGISEAATMCLRLDVDHLKDLPGSIALFEPGESGPRVSRNLRPIPQLWHDPLSTLSFGQGRLQNLMYMVAMPDGGGDMTAFVSLMESGDIEVRLVRGAPSGGDADSTGPAATPIFGIFLLHKQDSGCP